MPPTNEEIAAMPRMLWTFTGDANQDVFEWIRLCATTATVKSDWFMEPVSTYVKLFEAVDNIDGPVKAWFDGLNESIRRSFPKIMMAFAHRYGRMTDGEGSNPNPDPEKSRAACRKKALEILSKAEDARSRTQHFGRPPPDILPEGWTRERARIVDNLPLFLYMTVMRTRIVIGFSNAEAIGPAGQSPTSITAVRSNFAMSEAAFAQALREKETQEDKERQQESEQASKPSAGTKEEDKSEHPDVASEDVEMKSAD